MLPTDYLGYFSKNHHKSNFIYLISQLYPGIEHDYFSRVLPENELSFIYLVSAIFEDIIDYKGELKEDYFEKVIDQGQYLNDNSYRVMKIAVDLLNFNISINYKELPYFFGYEIKYALDILQSTNDLVKFTQYEVVSIAMHELELQNERLYNIETER